MRRMQLLVLAPDDGGSQGLIRGPGRTKSSKKGGKKTSAVRSRERCTAAESSRDPDASKTQNL